MSNLRNAVILRASEHSSFMASALAAWRTGRPEISLPDLLGCASDDLWQLELAPRPRPDAEFASAVNNLANCFGLRVEGLIQILRFADTISAISRNDTIDQRGLLLAARDDRRTPPPERDNE